VSKEGLRGPSTVLAASPEEPMRAEATAVYTPLFREGRFAVEVSAEFPTEPHLKGVKISLRTGDVGSTQSQGYTLRW